MLLDSPFYYTSIHVHGGWRIGFCTNDLSDATGARIYRRKGNVWIPVGTQYFKHGEAVDNGKAYRQRDGKDLIITSWETAQNVFSTAWRFDPKTGSLRLLQFRLLNVDERRAGRGRFTEHAYGRWIDGRNENLFFHRTWRYRNGKILPERWRKVATPSGTAE